MNLMSHTYSADPQPRKGIRVVFQTSGPSLTQQSAFDETDINQIVLRFSRTGELPEQRSPSYEDISSVQQLDPTSAIALSRDTILTVQNDVKKHNQKLVDLELKQKHDALVESIKKEISLNSAAPAAPAA